MNLFDSNYWTKRYKNQETAWDAGSITTPLKEYIDQLKNKEIRILVPGAGNSYEAEYLHNSGFSNVFVLDISAVPLENLKQRVPSFPEDQLLCEDFFTHQGQYDLILEQTFFCALDPSLREAYARKMSELLKKDGRLVGVLFEGILNTGGPPFGGTREEYLKCFGPYFEVRKLEPCYNSIKPRAGRELFIELVRK
jgi:thiopurine S-methyltransferase